MSYFTNFKFFTSFRLVMLSLLIAGVNLSKAQSFIYQGLYYEVLSESQKTVKTGANSYNSNCTGDIVLPEKVVYGNSTYTLVTIGEKSFSYNKEVTSCVMPNSITTIELSAFNNCTKLNSVTLSNSLQNIGSNAFYSTGLKEVVIPNSVKTIGDFSFANNENLEKVVIENGVESIGGNAFYTTSISEIVIPNSVKNIGGSAFLSCASLKKVVLGDGLVDLGSMAFRYCDALESVEFGNSLEIIGDRAFERTSLSSVVLPESLISLGTYVFYNCPLISEIEIGENMETIGENCFNTRGEINKVICRATEPPVATKYIFSTNITEATLWVPGVALDLYKDNYYWKGFKEVLPLDNYEGPTDVPATAIEIFPNTNQVLKVGESLKFTATIFPENATNQIVTWDVSEGANNVSLEVSPENPNIVVVTALAVGEALLDAYIEGETGWLLKQVLINIVAGNDNEVYIVIQGYGDGTIKVDEILQLTAKVYPEDTEYSNILWNSSNPKIATVNENGLVVGISLGEVVITATLEGNEEISDDCVIVVTNGSKINEIEADENGYYIVYSLSGTIVMSSMNSEDLKQLKRGFYIINHKKVFINR